jgi:hypothetical protein
MKRLHRMRKKARMKKKKRWRRNMSPNIKTTSHVRTTQAQAGRVSRLEAACEVAPEAPLRAATNLALLEAKEWPHCREVRSEESSCPPLITAIICRISKILILLVLTT